jgi:hypothetical protein
VSTFTQPDLIEALSERFVPVAIDSHDYRASRDADGRFFQGFAFAAKLNRINADGNRSYQGHYAVHPDGTLLAAQNKRGPKALRDLLARAQQAFAKHAGGDVAAAYAASGPRDPRYDRSAPPGTLVLNVYSRVSGWDAARQPERSGWKNEFTRWNRERAGVDHAWVLPAETRALVPRALTPGARHAAPRSLARRLARFHLVDTVRGEATGYGPRDLKTATLEVVVRRVSSEGRVELALEGRFVLEAGGKHPHAFDGTLEGDLVYDLHAERFTRFDLHAQGTASGGGRWVPGAPKGDFTLRVGFELRPADWASPEVAPHGARAGRGYLRP